MTNRAMRILLLLVVLSIYACKKNENSTPHVNYYLNNTQHASVATQHNDNTRAGSNYNEKLLTPANVNPNQFGKLFTLTVDDQVYAQPLVVGNLAIGTGKHNVVFIASVNNTIYAYDGDDGSLYWSKNYTMPGLRTPASSDMASNWCSPYQDITYKIGIVGTPVIDTTANTIYFVARSTDGNKFHQHLHAVDITTGNEQSGSPVEITASMPGTGDGSVNGTVSFDPRRNNQRQGLVLVNGVVYISFASHCDWNPYHGWILGYDARSLNQVTVYNDTPNGEGGGIWQSGMGLVADSQGNLLVATGNGTVGTPASYQEDVNGTAEKMPSPDPTNLSGRAESAMKLTPSGSTLVVSSYFTPWNYVNLNGNDQDLGVIGSFLIPNSNYYVTACKNGNLYILDANNMGGYSASTNNVHQTLPINTYAQFHCQPAFYISSFNEYMYIWSEYDQLRAVPFNRLTNTFGNNQTVSHITGPPGSIGAMISVSSNGSTEHTGIVWASYAQSGDAGHAVCPGILRAFDANNIETQLWSSDQNSGDNPGNFAKFSPPTIANGHVYLATFSGQVVVYGLK